MESIKLDRIEVNNGLVKYSFCMSDKLNKYFNSNCMFIDYGENMNDIPKSILVIPFVSLILPIIWSTNSILWVEEIDSTFYDSIPNIKRAYQEMYPNFRLRGTIVPAKTIENTYTVENEAIQLFSGGIDANSTFIRIRDKKPILINIYGWFKDKVTIDKVFSKDKEDISNFAIINNVDAKFIGSNFAKFINNYEFDKDYEKKIGRTLWFGFQHAMAFISISIPMAYKYKVRKIYISSSNTIGYRTACASDPTTDIQFKYCTVGGTVHDGFELTRQDKIRIICKYKESINSNYTIRVCSFNDKNCCECEKCFRTILGLVAEGEDIEKFGFNIEGTLKEHFQRVMDEKIQFLGLKKENEIYWGTIRKRMIENKNNIKEKEFVEWFLSYDFFGVQRKSLFKYRVKNFPIIIKKKLERRR